MRLFVNGKPLREYPITQSETGSTSHSTAKHRLGFVQMALDFGNMKADYPVTCDEPLKLDARSSSSGSYCCVWYKNIRIYLVHTYQWAALGTVPAGSVICKIAPSSVTGYAVHLHIWAALDDNKQYKIRDLIFAGGSTVNIVVGGYVKITQDTNIRHGSGTSYPVESTAQVGQIMKVNGGPRSADGYTWYDVQYVNEYGELGGTGWAVSNWMEPINFVPKPKPQDPVDPCKDVKAQLNAANAKIAELTAENAELQRKWEGDERIIAEMTEKIKEEQVRYNQLQEAHKKDLQTIAELKDQLEKEQEISIQKAVKIIIDVISKLFRRR